MFSGIKEKFGRELREKITLTRGIIFGALALFYLLLLILSAVPGISDGLTRLMGTEFRLPGRVICSMFRRILVVYTAGIGLYIAFVVGRRLSSKLDQLQMWLTRRCSGLMKIREERSIRGWLARHFLIPHNTDLFAVCWIGVYVIQFFLCLAGLGPVAWLLLLVPCFALGLRIGQGTPKRPGLVSRIFFGFLALIMAVCTVLLLSRFEALRSLVLAGEQSQGMLQSWLMSLVGLTMQSLLLSLYATQERKEYRARSLTQTVAVLTLLYLIMEVVLKALIDNCTLSATLLYARGQLFSPLVGFNVFFAVLIVLSLEAICGPKLGGVLSGILYLFLLIGNIIKIVFHDTLLLPIDLLTIKEMFLIMPTYIGWDKTIILIVFAILLLLLLIWKIKSVVRFLRPNLSVICAIFLVPFLMNFCGQISRGNYSELVDAHYSYYPETVNWSVAGTAVYNYYNLCTLADIIPSKPEDYSAETIASAEESFTELQPSGDGDVEPNVVLIMAESLFDVTQLEDVTFNLDPTQTISQYQVGSIVSPWYGGGTACVEYEGLTGFSNFFYLRDLCAYTTYLNDTKQSLPSLASEFSQAGYSTTAIHLSDPNFYNRRVVYQIMGFDAFNCIADYQFDEGDKTADGFIKDECLFQIIQDQLESSDEPQFIFAVTIEGHGPYNGKYQETDVQITDSPLSSASEYELEQYAQTVKEVDDSLNEFIEYLQSSDRPTIVYVWGDHLPNITAFDELNYMDSSLYAKYTTPFIAYSNYSDIDVDVEYMTPNQIAPQILRDAGIPHSSYYDYIYSLREDYPVIHHDYTVDLDSERLETYWMIQYDLMFGQQYLLN